jgi:hypothetical protein
MHSTEKRAIFCGLRDRIASFSQHPIFPVKMINVFNGENQYQRRGVNHESKALIFEIEILDTQHFENLH